MGGGCRYGRDGGREKERRKRREGRRKGEKDWGGRYKIRQRE